MFYGRRKWDPYGAAPGREAARESLANIRINIIPLWNTPAHTYSNVGQSYYMKILSFLFSFTNSFSLDFMLYLEARLAPQQENTGFYCK